MVTDSLKTKTAELSFEQFRELSNLHPQKQEEWVREHIDAEAVGVEGVEATFAEEEVPEAQVHYFVSY